MQLTPRVAAVLSQRVDELGLTQGALAAATGISQSQVSKLLRGVRVMDLEQMAAMCAALELNVADVVRRATS